MSEAFEKLFVAGGGAWGTALAASMAEAGRDVTLWLRENDVAAQINESHENTAFLPGVALSESLKATADPSAVEAADAMLMVIPAQFVRDQLPVFRDARSDKQMPIALCSKGIERTSGSLMHEVAHEVWPEASLAVLSGPSFAADVAKGQPTAVTLADPVEALGNRWLKTLATPTFRPYWSSDILGAELGGAIKNVLAIGCGVVEGRGLGDSAKAALMARGFAECCRFAEARGARAETLAGLSGLGDLILTCGSRQSRNMSLGYEIGRGRSAIDILAERRSVAEGAATAPVLLTLARELGVDMPITEAVVRLLEGAEPVDDVIERLMTRPLRAEP